MAEIGEEIRRLSSDLQAAWRLEADLRNEAERMQEALRTYAAIQPLHSKAPGQIQDDLRAIAGQEHIHVRSIGSDRCLLCRHDLRHEIHTRLPQKSVSEQPPEPES